MEETRSLALCLLFFLDFNAINTASDWTYLAPDSWSTDNPSCGLYKQSPININRRFVAFDNDLDPIHFSGYRDPPRDVSYLLKNNGHTVGLRWDYPDDVADKMSISGGALPNTFRLYNLHFHWGRTDHHGSEHLVDDETYAAEMHLVHINNAYDDIETALSHPDGLAVIGVFLEANALSENEAYSYITDYLHEVQTPDIEVEIPLFPLEDLLPHNKDLYYRYNGSLTTPPCSEAVIWTVLKQPVQLSPSQMSKFRMLNDKENRIIVDNYRPPTPLYGRMVYSSTDGETVPIHKEVDSTHHWSHKDTSSWSEDYPACGDYHQSPIHIHSDHSTFNYELDWIMFNGYRTPPAGLSYHLKNVGHSVNIQLVYPHGEPHEISIYSGGLPNTYRLLQFHFHWGRTDFEGSEHLVDNRAFAAELHFVHVNNDFENLDGALQHPHGIAVIAVLLEVGQMSDNEAYSHITHYLQRVRYQGMESPIPVFPLQKLLPVDRHSYYRYQGSLTTPPCSEAVIWTIFKQPVTVSSAQMSRFRELLDASNHTLVNNYRPPAPLNGRTVYSSYYQYHAMAGQVRLGSTTTISLAGLVLNILLMGNL